MAMTLVVLFILLTPYFTTCGTPDFGSPCRAKQCKHPKFSNGGPEPDAMSCAGSHTMDIFYTARSEYAIFASTIYPFSADGACAFQKRQLATFAIHHINFAFIANRRLIKKSPMLQVSSKTMNPMESTVQFLRRKDYVFIRELGQGSCGQTVLLRDEIIGSDFVCKKYAPISEAYRETLFKNFLREIKLLHEVHHTNVVRVFNYYVYPDKFAGYILMEFVDGLNIEEHLSANPETINEMFTQIIEGFSYLESAKILHRDIRPQNILVRSDGILKIIDLGFGKQVDNSADFDKSISLNWWCEHPKDFEFTTYSHTTEIYFVGKLFEKMIAELGIEHFKYSNLLEKMCERDPLLRTSTFFDVKTSVHLNQENDLAFTDQERQAYADFAQAITRHITKMDIAAKYTEDADNLRIQLQAIYRGCMLEDELPDAAIILRLLLRGEYFYRKAGFKTYVIKEFLDFLCKTTSEKQRVALANLHSRLDSIKRYCKPEADDIPF
jgi:hypothetical protein